MDIPLTPGQLDAIRRETLAGSKIQAIRLYREATGKGLAESKEAIETFETQWRAEDLASGPVPSPLGGLTPEQSEQICREILAGNKIQAIKLHREATGVGLAEAKQSIEYLTARLSEQAPPSTPTPASSPRMEPTPEQLDQIKAALREGNKIEAVKLHRQFTAGSLFESKQAIDALEAQLGGTSSTATPAPGLSPQLTPEQLEPIRAAALAGNLIQAIKLYREATGKRLAESKRDVEDLAQQWRAAAPGPTPAPTKAAAKTPDTPFARPAKTGCFGLILLTTAGFSTTTYWLLSR
jgi:ribosomal protein L7/L12